MFGIATFFAWAVGIIVILGFCFGVYYLAKNKKYIGLIFLLLLAAVLVVEAYLIYQKNHQNIYLEDGPRPAVSSRSQSENETIQKLLVSWKDTQGKFSSKAGESGTFNPPSRVQFISSDTLLVYYDDGLVDHISVLRFKNNLFSELKNVGVMSTMPQSQWQSLVSTYGDVNYPVSSYQSSDGKRFVKVSANVFVK